MSLINSIVNRYRESRLRAIESFASNAEEIQQKQLMGLIGKAGQTSFGKENSVWYLDDFRLEKL